MVKVLIFDFWGTLIENGVRPSPSKQVKYFLRVKMPFSEFITTFEHTFMTKKFDTLQSGFKEVTTAFNIDIPDFVYDKLIGMWNKFSILSHPYDETLGALESLKKDYKLVLLSNTDNFSLRQVMDKFDLDKYFDKVYLSCETGKLKSDPSVYQDIADEFKVDKKDLLMIGDSIQSDILGAQKAEVPAVLVDRRDWCRDENIPKVSSLLEIDVFAKDLK